MQPFCGRHVSGGGAACGGRQLKQDSATAQERIAVAALNGAPFTPPLVATTPPQASAQLPSAPSDRSQRVWRRHCQMATQRASF
jgi:hypothetical protein